LNICARAEDEPVRSSSTPVLFFSLRPIRRFRQCKTIGLVESKLLAQDGTLLATATASDRLLEAAKALRV
jgi:hypothetical protein